MQAKRRHLLLAFALGAVLGPAALAPTTAQAADTKAYTQAGFEAAKKAGGPILVEVTAPWCPTCKAQKPVLSKLFEDKRFAKLTVLTVDFDSQKDVLKALRVQQQSTLISFKGETEVARSTGIVDAKAIEAQLDKAI